MSSSSEYEKARSRAKAKYGFFVHALVYVTVMALLVVINLIGSPGYLWSLWPMAGWGLAIALHGARVFLLGDRGAIIDAMTEDELRRSGAGKRDGNPK